MDEITPASEFFAEPRQKIERNYVHLMINYTFFPPVLFVSAVVNNEHLLVTVVTGKVDEIRTSVQNSKIFPDDIGRHLAAAGKNTGQLNTDVFTVIAE